MTVDTSERAHSAVGDNELLAIRGGILDWDFSPKSPIAYDERTARLVYFADGILVWSPKSGRVVWRGGAARCPKKFSYRVVSAGDCVIFPGLIDSHVHLPQLDAIALDGLELLPWLEKFIFPTEKKYNRAAAAKYAPIFFGQLARVGTTTALVYGPAWPDAVHAAFDAALKSGLRVFLGQTLMDTGSYRRLGSNGAQRLLGECAEQIKTWHGRENRLRYVITPRFALSCSRELMEGAGSLAADNNLIVQTHLSENLGEIRDTLKRHPWAKSYYDVYAQTGLTGPLSVFAHCVHLRPEEVEAMRAHGAIIAWCPSSNLFLRSGILPRERVAGIPLTLGSDVAGGPDISLPETMKAGMYSLKARRFFDSAAPAADIRSVFHSATLAGRAFDPALGHINPGAYADFFAVARDGLFPGNSLETQVKMADGLLSAPDLLLSRLVYAGGRLNARLTVVGGNEVYRQ